jgi:hypothetical protein
MPHPSARTDHALRSCSAFSSDVYGHTISLTGDGRLDVRKQVAAMEAANMQVGRCEATACEATACACVLCALTIATRACHVRAPTHAGIYHTRSQVLGVAEMNAKGLRAGEDPVSAPQARRARRHRRPAGGSHAPCRLS